MIVEWNNLGTIALGSYWQSSRRTQSKSELFRLSFTLADRFWEEYNSPFLLSFRYWGNSGESMSLPPSLPFRLIPERRGILLEVPFARHASLLGCNSRVFEIKKSRRDFIPIVVQLEEMLYNVPPGDTIGQTPVPEIEFKSRNVAYSWQAPSGYAPKITQISLPILAILTKIASNAPIRIRLYQTIEGQETDLSRPPQINPKELKQRGIFLDAILGGNQDELQLNLSPAVTIAEAEQCYLTLEKLEPQSGTININLSFIG